MNQRVNICARVYFGIYWCDTSSRYLSLSVSKQRLHEISDCSGQHYEYLRLSHECCTLLCLNPILVAINIGEMGIYDEIPHTHDDYSIIAINSSQSSIANETGTIVILFLSTKNDNILNWIIRIACKVKR